MISSASIHTQNRQELAIAIRDAFNSVNTNTIKATSIENIKKLFTDDLESKYAKNVDTFDLKLNPFMQAIMHLTLLDDERKGIKSHFSKINSHWVLYRNDKTQGQPIYHNKKKHYENWAIIGLNFLDAAFNLLGHEQEKHLKTIATKFLDRLQKTPNAEIEHATMLHQVLYPFVAKELNISLSEAEKRLADARDFSNLKLPTTCVATRTQTEKGPIIEVDIPISGSASLCHQLKSQLKKINAFDDDEITKMTNIPWFDKLDLHVKKLLKKFAKEILAGKTMPTQLRKYLPGIRNAGESFLYDKYGELIDNNYHAALPSTELKSGNIEATKQGLLGLKKSIDAEHIIICALTTPLPKLLFGGDRGVTKNLKTALSLLPDDKKSKIHYANLPIHGYRRLPGIETFDGIDKILQIALSIKNSKNHQYRIHEKFNLLVKEIEHFQQLRSNINLVDFENNNLKTAASAERLSFLINEMTGKRKVAFIIACKSGKDRTGFLRFYCACYAYSKRFMKKIETVYQYFSHSNQPGKQAGWIGSTLGSCFFLKSMKDFGIPRSINQNKSISDLTASTAKANKGEFHNPSLSWYQQRKFWYAFAGFLIGAALTATGFGVIFGAPIIASSICMASVSLGITFFSFGLFDQSHRDKHSTRNMLLGATGIVIGILLCATGIGAAAGLPLFGLSAATLATYITLPSFTGLIGTLVTTALSLITAMTTLFAVKKTNDTYQYLKKFTNDHHCYEKNKDAIQKAVQNTIKPTTDHPDCRSSLMTTGLPMSLARFYASSPILDHSLISSREFPETKSPLLTPCSTLEPASPSSISLQRRI